MEELLNQYHIDKAMKEMKEQQQAQEQANIQNTGYDPLQNPYQSNQDQYIMA